MKISELTNAPDQLKAAKTSYEDVEIVDNRGIWTGGSWKGGIWEGGYKSIGKCKLYVCYSKYHIRIGCKEKNNIRLGELVC